LGSSFCTEAHGTATALGDPTETGAIAAAHNASAHMAPGSVGSHKGNVGHSESPSGIMGLLSARSKLEQAAVYGNMQLRRLSPVVASSIRGLSTPLKFATLSASAPHLQSCGVTNWGHSGTIVHAVLQHHAAAAGTVRYTPPVRLVYARCAFPWASHLSAVQSDAQAIRGPRKGAAADAPHISSPNTKSHATIDADTALMAAGFTSLMATRLATEIQAATGGGFISPVILFEFPTPRSLWVPLSRTTNNGSPPFSNVDELVRFLVAFQERAQVRFEEGSSDGGQAAPRSAHDDAQHLDADITAPPESTALLNIVTEPRMILLTGCTGYLGIFLLSELLRQTAATVFCLVRAETESDGMERLKQTAMQYALELPLHRCVIVIGSLAKVSLGLSPAVYQLIAHTVDAIWHCGAHNDHVRSYTELYPSNVQGTVEVLRLGVLVKLKPVHFISTYGTGVGLLGGVYYESSTPPTADQMADPRLVAIGATSGYALSKWVAEQLVLCAASRGLPVTVHRPARVLSSKSSGACNPHDMLTRLAVGSVQLGSLPDSFGGQEYGAAVDQVACASVLLGLDSQARGDYGQVYHLWEQQPINPGRLFAVLAIEYELSLVDHAEWIGALAQAESNVLRPLIHEVGLAEPVDFIPRYDSSFTLNTLARLGFQLGPSLDYEHVCKQITHLRRNLHMLHDTPASSDENWLLRNMTEMNTKARTKRPTLPSLVPRPSLDDEIEFLCMACDTEECNFRPVQAFRRPIGEWDVSIRVMYCGVCHTDLTFAAQHQPLPVQYPMVPGHEVVGICVDVGARVTRFQVGDHVGVGNLVDACLTCRNCIGNDEQWCPFAVATYNGRDWSGRAATGGGVPYTLGGYSTAMVVHEHFCIQIAADYPLEHAGPVMCAGTTMYNPLKQAGVGAGTRLGIVGLGGLGTMGLKLGKALGCVVVILSRTEAKRELAMALGADNYIACNDGDQVAAHAESLNLIINTIPSNHDTSLYSRLLATGGRQVHVGMHPASYAALAVDSLFPTGTKETMSMTGGVSITQEVMDLCVRQGIRTEIEVHPVSDLNRIFEALDATNESGKRFVLDIDGSLAGQPCVSTGPPTRLAPSASRGEQLSEIADALNVAVNLVRNDGVVRRNGREGDQALDASVQP